MPKKKRQRFSAAKAVKAAARELLGAPRPTRRKESERKRPREKHKPTMGKLLADE